MALTRPFRRARHPHVWLLAYVLMLLASLAVVGLSAARLHAYETDVRRDTFTIKGTIPAPVLRFTPVGRPLNVVAVIAHGYSADKEMMSAFGVDLAKQGIITYAFDLPGHGVSPVPYSVTGQAGVVPRLVTTVGEVVDYAVAHGPAPGTKVVLIGYSLGTIAAGEYALTHPQSAVAATVLVAGILQDPLTRTTPRSLLVLTGQYDLPGINDTAVLTMASACGVPATVVSDVYHCQGADASIQRLRVVLPGLDHIGIVTAGSTHAATISWLHQTVDARIGSTPVDADARLHWLVLGALAAALALLPLVGLGTLALGLGGQAGRMRGTRDATTLSRPSMRATGRFSNARGWLALAGSLAVSLLALRLWLPRDFFAPEPAPFGFLAQQVSADVALFFFIAGGVLLAVLRFMPGLRTVLDWPGRATVIKQIGLAAVAVVFLYLTLGQLSSFAWESLALAPARLWRAGVYAALIWPFFFGLRSLVAAWVRGRGWAWSGLVDLGGTLLVLAALVGAIVLNFTRLSYLGILLPVVAIVMIGFIGPATWTRRVMPHSAIFTATTQALLLGWLLAATLPLLG